MPFTYTSTITYGSETRTLERPVPGNIGDESRAIAYLMTAAKLMVAAGARQQLTVAMTLRSGARVLGTILVRPAEGLIEKRMFD